MDVRVWYRLEQVAAFLLAMDWNRAIGGVVLPRDIVRIVFDQTIGMNFKMFYEVRMKRFMGKLEKFSDDSFGPYPQPTRKDAALKEVAKKRREYEYQIMRIQDVIQRYRNYSNLFADIKMEAPDFTVRLWIVD